MRRPTGEALTSAVVRVLTARAAVTGGPPGPGRAGRWTRVSAAAPSGRRGMAATAAAGTTGRAGSWATAAGFAWSAFASTGFLWASSGSAGYGELTLGRLQPR